MPTNFVRLPVRKRSDTKKMRNKSAKLKKKSSTFHKVSSGEEGDNESQYLL